MTDDVRLLDHPALVSPSSRVPLEVAVPETTVRDAGPEDMATMDIPRVGAVIGLLATNEARRHGYRPRKLVDVDDDVETDEWVVKLEVDGHV